MKFKYNYRPKIKQLKMMESVPITIDLTYLYSLSDGDKAFEEMLLKCTIADVDIKIEELRKSLAINNLSAIRANAHSLVSLSAIAGMPQVEGWSRTIDQKMIDGIFHPELEVLTNSIISGWPSAKNELIKVLKNTLVSV